VSFFSAKSIIFFKDSDLAEERLHSCEGGKLIFSILVVLGLVETGCGDGVLFILLVIVTAFFIFSLEVFFFVDELLIKDFGFGIPPSFSSF